MTLPPEQHDRTSRSSSASTDLEMDNFDPQGRSLGSQDSEAAMNGTVKTGSQGHSDEDAQYDGEEIITADGTIITRQELAKRTFWHKSFINCSLIGLWYFFSVSISVYNKWMFADKELDFHFPLFTTSFHMVVQFGLASLALYIFPKYRPHAEMAQHRADNPEEPHTAVMTPRFYLTRIAPCASATGLDIGLGNTSLRFVTLTFFTMCKSSTLGFVLLFAVIFGLERMSWKLAGIIAVMTFGVVLMVFGEIFFSAVGFILLMMASFFSGLRWSLTQILLKRNPATSNPFASLFFLTPIMFFIIFILALPVEGPGELLFALSDLADRKGGLLSFIILVTPGILAFLMTASEFALLQRTSVVTLSVCGIFKEVLTIGAGGIFFNDIMTPINILGIIITITAIGLYNYMRVKKMKEKSLQDAQVVPSEQAPMLTSSDGSAQLDAQQHRQRSDSQGSLLATSFKISSDLSVGREASQQGKSPPSRLPHSLD